MLEDQAQRKADIAALEQRAAALLQLKRESRPRRPILIEFCGSPKAGKTTRINSLELFLKRNEFRVHTISERAALSPIKNKRSPTFNMWTLGSVLAEISAALEGGSDAEVVIVDRGYFDALCWFTWFELHGQISEAESAVIASFVTSRLLAPKLDLVIVLTATAETSFDREYANLLTIRQGSIMNTDALNSYGEALKLVTERFGTVPRSIKHIDTTGKEQNEVSVAVTNMVLDVLEDQLTEKIACVERTALTALEATGAMTIDRLNDLELRWIPRPEAEANDNVVQLVSVGTIYDSTPEHVDLLMARKSSKSTQARNGKRSPERGQTLAYVGGHVRYEDSYLRDTVRDVCRETAQREIKEEIGLDISVLADPILIWDRSRDRSAQHLCVAHPIDLPSLSSTKFRVDKFEFSESRSQSHKPLEVLPLTDVIQTTNLENWSLHIIKRLFDADPTNFQTSLDFDSPTL